MASPKIGQTKTVNGKQQIWSGQNYGWQSPASNSKLKEQGKLKHGAQALDRLAQTASRRLSEVANSPVGRKLASAQKEFVKQTDKIPGVKQAEKAVQRASDASANTVAARGAQGASSLAQKGANALNIDPRIAAAGLLVGQVAIGKAVGAKQATTPNAKARIVAPRPKGALTPKQAAGFKYAARKLQPPIQGPKRPPVQGAAKPPTRTTTRPTKAQQVRTVKSGLRDRGQAHVDQTLKGQNVAKQARGPIKPASDGTTIPSGNTITKAPAANAARKANNQDVAITEYSRRVTNRGGKASTSPRGNDLVSPNPKFNKSGTTGRVIKGRTGPVKSPALDAQGKKTDAAGWNDRTRAISDKARDSNLGTAFMPDGGRVNPRRANLYTRLSQKAELGGRSGLSERRSAVRALTRKRANEAKAKAAATQRELKAKQRQGTTTASRETMASAIALRPKTQGPRLPATTTTGTRRIPANSVTKSSTGVRGKVISKFTPTGTKATGETTTIRSKGALRPKTTVDKYPSRTSKGNPVESFSPKTRRATRLQGKHVSPNATRSGEDNAAAYKKLSPGERASYSRGLEGPRTPQDNPGLRVGGIRRVDGRGSSTPKYRDGANPRGLKTDSVQIRTNPPDKNGVRPKARNIRRLGESGRGNVDTYETPKGNHTYPVRDAKGKLTGEVVTGRKAQSTTRIREARAASDKDIVEATSTRAKTPTRSKAAQAKLAKIKEQLQESWKERKSQLKTPKAIQAAKRKWDQAIKLIEQQERQLNPNYDGSKRSIPATHISGEVRIQGSKYGTDPKTARMVDGSVTRTTGREKPSSRSAEAKASAATTMASVRAANVRRNSARALAAGKRPLLPGKKVKAPAVRNTIKARSSR